VSAAADAAKAATGAATTAAGAATTGAPTPVRTEATIVPVPALAAGVQPRVRALTCIEAGGATILEADLSVAVVSLDDGTSAVRVSTANATAMAGLYVGMVEDQSRQPVAPVQLYLSRAEAPRP
jgi:hypothetical protein